VPTLTYPTGDFQPFTKILSSEVNGKFDAIKTLLNVTKLNSDNVQVNGLTRDRLATGTANAVVVNATSGGGMSELASVNNAAVYFNASGVPSAGTLPVTSGGTGQAFALTGDDANKVLTVNDAGTGFELAASAADPTTKIYAFYRFT
jgi:hypothetical protein